jgi:pimeloyl-ACP methyl ester carboxylesterase
MVSLDGIDGYYESHGDGPPLLLIGGMSQPVDELRPMIDRLAGGLRVVAMDNRGTGRTSAPPGPYSVEQMAGDVLALMDRLGIGRAHLLGISMGGRIALAIALAQPQRVDRLVLVSTSARVPGLRLRLRLGMLLTRLRSRRAPTTQPGHAVRAQFAASTRYDCLARLAEIARPTLVVHGRTDPIVPLRLAAEMQRRIAGSRLVLLDGGHRITLDPACRDDVSAAVLAFLRAAG